MKLSHYRGEYIDSQRPKSYIPVAMGLNGSTTIITGGTGALGQVVARRFLEQGSNVASSYLVEDELKRLSEEFKQKVFIVRADVSRDEDVTALFSQVIARFGRVDILIN